MESNNYVLACNKINSFKTKQLNRIELNSLNCTVEQLAQQISKILNLDRNTFDLVCFGKTLDVTKPLHSFGITDGVVIYLTTKSLNASENSTLKQIAKKEPMDAPLPPKEMEHRAQLCIALKSALMNALFRKFLKNVADIDVRENLIAVNPELEQDPTLFGVLGDWYLLNSFITRKNIRQVLEKYPHFLDVATNMSAAFNEEDSGSSSALHYDRSSFMNYSIDAMSSDEEMDSSDASSVSSNIAQQPAASSNRPLQSIDQSFAQMLMRFYETRHQPASTSNVITSDMLRNALQSSLTTPQQNSSSSTTQASTSQTVESRNAPVATDTHPAVPPPSQQIPPQSSTNASRSTADILIGWAPQLRQMRELGITDDIVAIQALEATNGDVQAAINIIFSDFS